VQFADSTCDCYVRNSNIWASNDNSYSYGILSHGSPVKVSGSKFVGFAGAAISAGGGAVDASANQFDDCAIGVADAGGFSKIANNVFVGRVPPGSATPGLTDTALISLQPASLGTGSYVIANNLIEDTDSAAGNPAILLAHNASGVISGNSFRKVNISGSLAHIIEVEAGPGAGAVAMLVTSNTFRAGADGSLAKGHAISPEFKGMASNNLGSSPSFKTVKTDDEGTLQPLVAFVPADWHTVGKWSHIGATESGEVQAIASMGTLDSRLAVYKKTAFSTFDVTFEFSLNAADSTTAAFLFGVAGPEEYYALDFPADGQQRRAENLWATISRVNGSRTGSGCFRETLVMERVHGLTSAAGVWHTVRVKLDSLGDLSVWVGDKIGHLRPLRPFGRREHGDASLGVRPALVGLGTYSDGAPVFGGLVISTGEMHSPANHDKVAWPATTSVAYRTLTEAAVWGMQLNSLLRTENGDLVGLSNNGKALGVNGVNALIRSTDRGRSFVKENVTLPWPNYLYYGASLLATATHIEAYFLGPIGVGHRADRVTGKPFTLGRATSKDQAGKIWGPVEMLERNVSFAAFETSDNIRVDDLAQCSLARLKDGTLLLSATAQ
jgi:hypothetical protein